jgi:glycosidase
VPLSFWREWLPAIHTARTDVIVIGEVMDGGPTNLAPFLDAGFDSLFNYPLYYAMRDAFAGRGSVDVVANKVNEEVRTFGYAKMLMMTNFIGNHDNPRFASAVPGDMPNAEIVQRHHLALCTLFTLPGIVQLYYGDELGMIGAKDPDNRRDMPSWAWTKQGREALHPGEAAGRAEDSYAYVKQLVALRSAHPSLSDGSYTEIRRKGTGDANVWAFLRSRGADRLLVVLNNGDEPAQVSLGLRTNAALGESDRAALVDGASLVMVLEDVTGGGAPRRVPIAGGALGLTLPARTAAIYSVVPPIETIAEKPTSFTTPIVAGPAVSAPKK